MGIEGLAGHSTRLPLAYGKPKACSWQAIKSAVDSQATSTLIASPIRRWHRRRMPFTYILRCADDTLYVGHTDDLASREQLHNEGRGAAYTARRTPVRMVYAEEHPSIEGAIAREHQLKRWSNKKKQSLIEQDRWALSSYAHKPLKLRGISWSDLPKRAREHDARVSSK